MGAYLYGDLAPDEMRELRVHAQDCVLCREDLATRGRVVSSLPDASPALSDTDRQRIAWSVKGAIRKREVRTRPLALRLAPAFALAAAVLAVGFLAGRMAIRTAQHSPGAGELVKRHSPPGAKVEIKETTPDPSKTGKAADQLIDLLRSMSPSAGITGGGRQGATGSRHWPVRKAPMSQDVGVKVAPGSFSPAPAYRPQAAPDNIAVTPKESSPGLKNTETGPNSENTKLPRVTDPKNAETTPSESQ